MSTTEGTPTPRDGEGVTPLADDEIVVGMVRFRVDPRRRPRPAALSEEEMLWRRLDRRLGDGEDAGLDPGAFAEWWRSAGRGA